MVISWEGQFAGRMAGMKASEIRELLKLIDQPDIISFAGGVPEADLFPHQEIARAYNRVLESNSLRAVALQYSISEGYTPLREWICQRLNRRWDLRATPDNVMITNGSQQGLEFLGKLLISAGDLVAVSRPTYLGALQAFSPYEPRYVMVAMDEGGVVLESLAAALAQKPKFLYLVPDFQNPNGVTLAAERRAPVVAMCAAAGVPIIEDAAYVQLRYDGAPLPPLLAIDAALASDTDVSKTERPTSGYRPNTVTYA
ncbi:hypothetical protein CCP2SC5_2370002 [Azospirillaceae bacterium]